MADSSSESKCLKQALLCLHKIPNKFTNKYGGGLSNPLFLKPPDGTEWKVYWTKHDGEIWFQKGWKEFARYYSLDHGHMVMFEYEGASHFDVHIFDKSATEIDYTFHGTQDEKDSLDQISDDSVEILNELAPCQKTRLKSPISFPQPHKKLRTGTTGDVERSFNLNSLPQNGKTIGNQSRGTNIQKSPFSSLKKELDESVQGDGVNWLDPENTLIVESKTELTNTGGRANQRTLLIRPRPGRRGALKEALKEAMKFISDNPFFIVDLRTSYVEGYRPCVPTIFIRNYLNKKQIVMLQIGKKLWPVKVLYYPKKVHLLSSGWSLFAKESKLQTGDVCIFELINREDAVLDVHIVKGH